MTYSIKLFHVQDKKRVSQREKRQLVNHIPIEFYFNRAYYIGRQAGTGHLKPAGKVFIERWILCRDLLTQETSIMARELWRL